MLQEKFNFEHNYIFRQCIYRYIHSIFGNWIIIPKVTHNVYKKHSYSLLEIDQPLHVCQNIKVEFLHDYNTFLTEYVFGK